MELIDPVEFFPNKDIRIKVGKVKSSTNEKIIYVEWKSILTQVIIKSALLDYAGNRWDVIGGNTWKERYINLFITQMGFSSIRPAIKPYVSILLSDDILSKYNDTM
jgi:hypothetical protein